LRRLNDELTERDAESGDVWIDRESGKALVPVGNFSMPHARTVSVDPKTHLVYFPLENVDGHPILRTHHGVQIDIRVERQLFCNSLFEKNVKSSLFCS
jgi:hypothetical protein